MLLSLQRSVLTRVRAARRHIHRRRFSQIYNRYRAATMIPRGTFLDNLELAHMLAQRRDLAGYSIVECGTWRGGMAAALIEIYGRDRPYHFFDSFAGLPPAKEIDGVAARQWQEDISSPKYYDNCTASKEEFLGTIGTTGKDLSQIHVHEGLFQEPLAE